LAPAAVSPGRCSRIGRCRRWQSLLRATRSRPLLCSVRGYPTSSRRVRATPAQKSERGGGADVTENPREFDCVVHRYCAELCIRYRPGIGTQAEDRCMLIREQLREFRAVGEILMDKLIELGIRDADLSAPDRRRTSNGGVIECIEACTHRPSRSRLRLQGSSGRPSERLNPTPKRLSDPSGSSLS
jgi:hypothetical protein